MFIFKIFQWPTIIHIGQPFRNSTWPLLHDCILISVIMVGHRAVKKMENHFCKPFMSSATCVATKLLFFFFLAIDCFFFFLLLLLSTTGCGHLNLSSVPRCSDVALDQHTPCWLYSNRRVSCHIPPGGFPQQVCVSERRGPIRRRPVGLRAIPSCSCAAALSATSALTRKTWRCPEEQHVGGDGGTFRPRRRGGCSSLFSQACCVTAALCN